MTMTLKVPLVITIPDDEYTESVVRHNGDESISLIYMFSDIYNLELLEFVGLTFLKGSLVVLFPRAYGKRIDDSWF